MQKNNTFLYVVGERNGKTELGGKGNCACIWFEDNAFNLD